MHPNVMKGTENGYNLQWQRSITPLPQIHTPSIAPSNHTEQSFAYRAVLFVSCALG